MLTEEKFFTKANEFFLYKNTDKTYYTFEEFSQKIENIQKDKNGKTVILYTNNYQEQHSFVEAAKDKGYEVLELEGPLISHLISN